MTNHASSVNFKSSCSHLEAIIGVFCGMTMHTVVLFNLGLGFAFFLYLGYLNGSFF